MKGMMKLMKGRVVHEQRVIKEEAQRVTGLWGVSEESGEVNHPAGKCHRMTEL